MKVFYECYVNRKNYSVSFIAAVLGCLFFTACLTQSEPRDLSTPSSKEVREKIKSVTEWQLKNYPSKKWSTNWLSSTLFIGITEIAKKLKSKKYWLLVNEWAKKNNWQIDRDPFNADNQGSAQVYLELYSRSSEPEKIRQFKSIINSIDRKGMKGRELWDWSDALFMAPPGIAKLGKETGDNRYYQLLNRLFWDAHKFLYDREHHLFYRDNRFFYRTDVYGNKIFWSRGNGWAIAGIARILQNLPESNYRYNHFMKLYTEMIHKIVSLQQEDGLWRTSLLSPTIYSTPETSGTAFFCYALGWGLNNGVLKEHKFEVAFVNSWEGLVSKITSNGKLGSVQSVASKPGNVNPDNSELYATGAFLLAASEMYVWSKNYE